MKRLLARLWLYFNRADFCWEHTEQFCHVCAGRRVEADRRARKAKQDHFVRMLMRAGAKGYTRVTTE